MTRLMVYFSLIAVACSTSTPQATNEIPVTTQSAEARRRYEKGLALSENSRPAEAIEEFRLALELDPGFASARAVLAFHTPGDAGLQEIDRATREAAALPEAERAFIEVLRARRRSDPTETVAAARNLVALVPDAPRARTALGQALLGAQHHAAAAAEAQKALDLNPQYGPALNLLGYSMLQQGKTAEAIDAFQQYAAVLPQEPNPQDSLGDALLAAGRYADAEAAFRKAVEISPRFWNGYEGIACAKFYQGDFAGAREAFENGRRVAEHPSDRATLEQVAAFEALAENEPADAMKVLETIEQIPNASPDQMATLPIGRALVFLHSGKTREALAELEKVTRLSASGTLPPPVAHRLRGYALAVRSTVEAAMNDLDAVTRTATMLQQDAVARPDDPMAQSAFHFAMGTVALAKGDRNGAIEHWEQCSVDHTLCQGYLVMHSAAGQPASGPNAATLLARARANPRDPIFLYLSSIRPKS